MRTSDHVGRLAEPAPPAPATLQPLASLTAGSRLVPAGTNVPVQPSGPDLVPGAALISGSGTLGAA